MEGIINKKKENTGTRVSMSIWPKQPNEEETSDATVSAISGTNTDSAGPSNESSQNAQGFWDGKV